MGSPAQTPATPFREWHESVSTLLSINWRFSEGAADLSLQSPQGCSLCDYGGPSKALGRKSSFLPNFRRIGGFNRGKGFLLKGYNPQFARSAGTSGFSYRQLLNFAGRVIPHPGFTPFQSDRRRRPRGRHIAKPSLHCRQTVQSLWSFPSRPPIPLSTW